MEVENLEKWKSIVSWRFKKKKIEQGNQFKHPPSFHSIYASYFQASSHLELKSNPS